MPLKFWEAAASSLAAMYSARPGGYLLMLQFDLLVWYLRLKETRQWRPHCLAWYWRYPAEFYRPQKALRNVAVR